MSTNYQKIISPIFISEFKYVFGRIKEGLHSDVERIFITKRQNFYNKILDLFVREGFIKGYKELGEVLVIYFSRGLVGSKNNSLTSIKDVRWYHRRPSLRIKDIRRWQRRSGTAMLILNTDKGVLTANEAIRFHIGGFPLFKII